MPSNKPLRRLEDIIENAQAIFDYTKGMSLSEFEEDRKTYDAVERCFERISEASGRLGEDVTQLMPDVPWQKIRAFGNRLRHEYDAIQEDRLWEIIERDLPSLLSACKQGLRRLQAGQVS